MWSAKGDPLSNVACLLPNHTLQKGGRKITKLKYKQNHSWLDSDLPRPIARKLYEKGVANMAELNKKLSPERVRLRNPKRKHSLQNYKVRYLGDKVEILHYGMPKIVGYERKWTPTRKEGRTMANEQNAKRARKAIFEIVEMNKTPYSKMITLTYKENMEDYDRLAHDFKMFIKNMKRKGYQFPYLWVVEKQKRGALHVHLIAFQDEYIPVKHIKTAWKHGFVKINAQFQEIDHKGAYIAKYIQKETMPPEKKAYRTSRNIKRPTEKAGLGSVGHAVRNARERDATIRETSRTTFMLSQYGAFVDEETGELKQQDPSKRGTVVTLERKKQNLDKKAMSILEAQAKRKQR